MGSSVLGPVGLTEVEVDEQSTAIHKRFGADRPVRAHWREGAPDLPVVVAGPSTEQTTSKKPADYMPRHAHTLEKMLWLSVSALAEAAAKTYLMLFAALALWSVVPTVWGWNARVVMTGSMEPSINPGDVIVASPFDWFNLEPGQVVIVNDLDRPGQTLSHRYVNADVDGKLITKGDNNASEDSAHTPLDQAKGIVRLRVPMIGLPKVWMADHNYLPLVTAVGFTFLSMMIVWGGERRKERHRDRLALDKGPRRSRERETAAKRIADSAATLLPSSR